MTCCPRELTRWRRGPGIAYSLISHVGHTLHSRLLGLRLLGPHLCPLDAVDLEEGRGPETWHPGLKMPWQAGTRAAGAHVHVCHRSSGEDARVNDIGAELWGRADLREWEFHTEPRASAKLGVHGRVWHFVLWKISLQLLLLLLIITTTTKNA